jgi:glycerophosphoryl diester phosphodiesterase
MTPLVFAHRGASGYRPEHTLPGYALALEQGADAIEPDLVLSRDGVFYCRHEPSLLRTTDIARRLDWPTLRSRPGVGESGLCTGLDAAELDRLRAIEPYPGRSRVHDGLYRIPRFTEVLALAEQESGRRGREVMVVPEVKQPREAMAVGLDPLGALLGELPARWQQPDAPLIVQCFDWDFLRALKSRAALTTMALFESGQVFNPRVLRGIAEWIGVPKAAVIDSSARPTGLVAQAHAAGLKVAVWTFRRESVALCFDSLETELAAHYATGVDAVFADYPDIAVRLRDARSGTQTSGQTPSSAGAGAD